MNFLKCYDYANGIAEDNIKSLRNKLEHENVQCIYGGVTNKNIDEQVEKHINDSDDMIDDTFKVCELMWYKLNKDQDFLNESYDYVNEKATKSLIEYLNTVYGKRCINNENVINDIMLLENDGEEFGDTIVFYVMYK